MIFAQAEPFITSFVESLDKPIREKKTGYGLTIIQKGWISFCIMAIIATNSVCWARFERYGLKRYSLAALSWMLHHSLIPWEFILSMSVLLILRRYGIKEGILVLDDTDRKRSKSTRKIAHVHKIKDKGTGGFCMGQCIVFLVLVTAKITIPVGFKFHMPNPALTAWNKAEKLRKKQGLPVQQREPKPPKTDVYPTKIEIALTLLEQFKQDHPDITIQCVLADALYGPKEFVNKASSIFGGVQVISQLRMNQNIVFRNRKMSVKKYFSKYPGTLQEITIRGGKCIRATIGSARLQVCAHGKKCFVIAVKYEGEDQYRYICASDLTWRTVDIVQAYTLRWLIEVFHEDWKSYEGWGKLTKHQGDKGSSRGLILSLLTDHCLLLHPEQLARIENKLPAYTVGSLQAKVKVDSLMTLIREMFSSNNPQERLDQLCENLKEIFTPEPSEKHMIGRDLGRLVPTPSLKYRTV